MRRLLTRCDLMPSSSARSTPIAPILSVYGVLNGLMEVYFFAKMHDK